MRHCASPARGIGLPSSFAVAGYARASPTEKASLVFAPMRLRCMFIELRKYLILNQQSLISKLS